jgi:4'-phosphopantetheinyl transferase
MPQVFCNHVQNKQWGNLQDGYAVLKEAHIWPIQISTNLHLLQECKNVLHPEETERAKSYRLERDSSRFILSRGVLRYLLGKYLDQLPKDIRFTVGKNKKPFVQKTAAGEVHYNIAHSGDWILIAVSDKAIGVDIEFVDTHFPFSEVLPVSFSREEIQFIRTAEQPLDNFYLLWTRKEALIKATSKGIDDDMRSIPSLNGSHFIEPLLIDSTTDWVISSFEVAKQYIGSVCCEPGVGKIVFTDIANLMSKM